MITEITSTVACFQKSKQKVMEENETVKMLNAELSSN